MPETIPSSIESVMFRLRSETVLGSPDICLEELAEVQAIIAEMLPPVPPALVRLAVLVDGLNPRCREIGPGMMATMMDHAATGLKELAPTARKN